MKLFLSIFLFVFLPINQQSFSLKLSNAALELTKDKVTYDPSYVGIKYPNGDVAKDKGVCTDVIIRAYRKLGIDLQKKLHEDLKANFSKYPNLEQRQLDISGTCGNYMLSGLLFHSTSLNQEFQKV